MKIDSLFALEDDNKFLRAGLIISITVNILLLLASCRLFSDHAVREISLGSFACILIPLTIINILSSIALWKQNKIGLWGCLGALTFFTIYAISFRIALSGIAPFLLIFAIILAFVIIAGVAIARRQTRQKQ